MSDHDDHHGDRVAAAARGDDEALALLVRAHHDRVYRFGLRVCRDGYDADDAVQEAFSKLATRPDVARDPSALFWLFCVVRHACMRHRWTPTSTCSRRTCPGRWPSRTSRADSARTTHAASGRPAIPRQPSLARPPRVDRADPPFSGETHRADCTLTSRRRRSPAFCATPAVSSPRRLNPPRTQLPEPSEARACSRLGEGSTRAGSRHSGGSVRRSA